MKPLEKYIYYLSGFTMPEYKVCITEFNQNKLPAILTDNFCIDTNNLEKDFGLYINNWIKVTHKVLWQIDSENSILYLFSNSIHLISNYLSIELKSEKADVIKGFEDVVLALAEAHLFIEKFVFNIEGNWLLKRRNAEPTNLIRYFIFWAASRKVQHLPVASFCFSKFISCYADDVSLNEYDMYNDEEMISAFMQSFYRNINDKNVFQQILYKELIF